MEALGRLPKVLQNEILEFARGDRKFWRSQFTIVMDQISYVSCYAEVRAFQPLIESQKLECLFFYTKVSQGSDFHCLATRFHRYYGCVDNVDEYNTKHTIYGLWRLANGISW